MAIPVTVQSLLSGREVEWARVEFKKSWDPETSLKTICAFANDRDNWGGGYVVIGVEETNGIPQRPTIGVPLDKADAWQKSIYEKCKLITPDYMPIVGVEEHNNKKFLIIWCPGGYGRPYSAPKTMAKGNRERKYYIRKGSITGEPSEEDLKDLFTLSNRTPYDDQVNHRAELSDLNLILIKSYLREIGSGLYGMADTMDFVELCRSMHLVSDLPEYIKPRNVALMFFNSEPDRFFPCAQIDVVQFPEGEGGDNIIERIFKGPLHEQLRAAIRYIKNTIITEKIVKHPDRPEADRFFNYPIAAIEEALANAVYHKAYDEREPIEVRIHNDRIEIVSHPGPDRSVTMENLKKFTVYSRRYRNRRIGDFLKELHLTEGRNTGFKKILNALKANGSPLPEFETDKYHDYFVSRFFIRKGFHKNGSPGKNVVDNVVENVVEDPWVNELSEKIAGFIEGYSNKKKQKTIAVLKAIKENSRISASQMAKSLNSTERTIQRYISELRKANIIRREGNDTAGKWIIN